MLRACLYQCRPDEAEILRWYIERKQYDFAIYNNAAVTQLARESDIWANLQSGTRIIMRAIIQEVPTVTTTYKCPCGTQHTLDVSIEDLVAALQRGCTIIWWVLSFNS